MRDFEVGDRVEKTGGDYSFVGFVRGVFMKKSGLYRYAVENDAGILHIFSAMQLRHIA